jgi:hypothetical protein
LHIQIFFLSGLDKVTMIRWNSILKAAFLSLLQSKIGRVHRFPFKKSKKCPIQLMPTVAEEDCYISCATITEQLKPSSKV